MDSKYIISPDGNFISEDELYHHGIKGMKWGVRRYQNTDGSLTSAGRKRYYNDDGSPTSAGRLAINSHKINIRDQREMQKKFHDSKDKKENEFSNRQYLLSTEKATKGEKYVKQLKKEILHGYVTSFVEDSKGSTDVKGKTSKGVVIRDKEGNRVTAYDYRKAQSMIYKHKHDYISTGQW